MYTNTHTYKEKENAHVKNWRCVNRRREIYSRSTLGGGANKTEGSLGQQATATPVNTKPPTTIGGGDGGNGSGDKAPDTERSLKVKIFRSGGLIGYVAKTNRFDWGNSRFQVSSSGTSVTKFTIKRQHAIAPYMSMTIGSSGLVHPYCLKVVPTIGPNSGARNGNIVGDFTTKPGWYTVSNGRDSVKLRVYSRSTYGIRGRSSADKTGPDSTTGFLQGADTEPTIIHSKNKGNVNQKRTKNRRAINGVPKGSVTVVNRTPKW